MQTGDETWVGAGLLDLDSPQAEDRRALLGHLQDAGVSLKEMVSAHRRGRLFAVLGDRLVRPDASRFTLRAASRELGVELAQTQRLWRALGLPDTDPDEPAVSPDDVRMLRVGLQFMELLGEDTVLGLARVIGAAASRVASASASVVRVAQPDLDVAVSSSELVTAQAWGATAQLVPALGQVLDTALRHHIESERRYFEQIASTDRLSLSSHALRLAVGFADLCGFTALSRDLPLHELSAVVSAFESHAADTVRAQGGRLVKFIGDAVMFTAPDASRAAHVATALVCHPTARMAGIEVRAGAALGAVLSRDGDVFGTPVNLAARLVALAEPGQLLLDRGIAGALDPGHWRLTALPAQSVRGFAEPVETWAAAPVGARPDTPGTLR